MALNLDDQKAIDYSGEISYYPRDAFGDAVVTLLGYSESGTANTEENKSDKEYDVATVRVESFKPATVDAKGHPLSPELVRSEPEIGQSYILWFQTGGNGITMENRAYKAAELGQFVVAACGLEGPEATGKVRNAKRLEMLKADYSDGTDTIAIRQLPSKKIPTDKKAYDVHKGSEQYYSNKVYSAT